MESGYSRHSKLSRITKPVAIVAVSPTLIPPQATGISGTREYVQIDISHFVGAVQVTPAVGEQWMIVRDAGIWKLDQKLPHNIPSTLQPRSEGQTRIGSTSGATEIDGTQINLNAVFRLGNTLYRDTRGSLERSSDNGTTWSLVSTPLPTPQSYATVERPAANSVAKGESIFDTTLNKPIWSDGTDWRDAAGTIA